MTVIAVFNQKGGVGKTTTCHNVSAALARLERRPIAIDLDPQSHLSLACGVELADGRRSAFSFFNQQRKLGDLVMTMPDGLRLIPGHFELSKVDSLFGRNPNITTHLKNGIQESFGKENVPILIDCCPMLGVLSLNAMVAADRVLIPVSADYLSMQGVARLEGAIKVLESHLKRKIVRKVVITRFDSRRRFSHEIYQRLLTRFGNALCETKISESVGIAESPVHGKSVFGFAPDTKGAKEYQALVNELDLIGFFDKNFVIDEV